MKNLRVKKNINGKKILLKFFMAIYVFSNLLFKDIITTYYHKF